MQSTYSNLSRYSDDLENLFNTLITNVNVDEELSKLRASMSKLHRDPKMPLQIPLYKLKSAYELLLGISFPLMDPDEILTKSVNYAVNCAKYFVSKNTNSALESYIQLKLTKGERLNVNWFRGTSQMLLLTKSQQRCSFRSIVRGSTLNL